ncbi:MAG: hypothetical protein AAGA80_06805 [Cyanobacteria bacterium P01_F01_bin.143]
MNDTVTFFGKILILSTTLSVLIKYGGRLLSVSPTVTIAIVAILLPSIIIAIALAWRTKAKIIK